MHITRSPAGLDPVRGEIDIFALIFTFEPGSEQTHQVHVSTTPPAKQFLHRVLFQCFARQVAGQVVDDMPQMVQLALVLDMVFGSARELNILLPDAELSRAIYRNILLLVIDRLRANDAENGFVLALLTGNNGIAEMDAKID